MTTPTPPLTPNPLHTVPFPSALLPQQPQLAWPRRKDPSSASWYWLDFTAWLLEVGGDANILSSATASVAGGDGMLTITGPAVVYQSSMVAIQLSAGTAGQSYTVTFLVVTSGDAGSTQAAQVLLTVDNLLTI